MLLAADVLAADRCRANMAYARPAYGRGFQVQDFEILFRALAPGLTDREVLIRDS